MPELVAARLHWRSRLSWSSSSESWPGTACSRPEGPGQSAWLSVTPQLEESSGRLSHSEPPAGSELWEKGRSSLWRGWEWAEKTGSEDPGTLDLEVEGTDWKVAPLPEAMMKWLLLEQGAEEELVELELPANTSNCLESDSESSWWTLDMSRSGWRPECEGAWLGSSAGR